MLTPLKLEVEQYGTVEGVEDHIRYARSLNLQETTPTLVAHDGTFIIVGSGPSLAQEIDTLKQEDPLRPICAINGAHDFLIDHGITPDLFLTVDPRPMPQNFKRLNDQTIYCIASRANPGTFDALKGRKIVLWHAWGQENENELFKDCIAIGGGTTSGLRAINYGYVQGFRKFRLYGMDSCLGEKNEKRVNDRPLPKSVTQMDVIVGDRTFWCNAAMAQQANEFQLIYEVMPDATVTVVGGGLLAAILEERKKQGMPC